MEIPSDLIPVKGHPGWQRDQSGVLHNMNSAAIDRAKEKKQKRKAQSQRIDNLETDVKEIKGLLQQLINKL